MRGNRDRPVGTTFCRRSIPAHAGEPAIRNLGPVGSRVYPRACGGTLGGWGQHNNCVGLSPRMRGNHIYIKGIGRYNRSIPAHAGEPTPDKKAHLSAWVYPRACGGTAEGTQGAHCEVYPRACGGTQPRGHKMAPSRVYPRACGGTDSQPWPVVGSRVYPRACGGTVVWFAVVCPRMGLSPRMRGNRSVWAGERHYTRVYPRACGGTPANRVCRHNGTGLSPRMRGNRRGFLRRGSIPAHAGEPPVLKAGVYPRACGGTAWQTVKASRKVMVYPRACGGTPCS